jgi:hypothetical protein
VDVTTPSDSSFDYTDDSVIARVAFDIPHQAVGDVSQLTAAMSAMRTELESIARAQSDWMDYLRQVPEITSRANQAIREQITLMERMSYVQGEVGVGGGGGKFWGGGGGGAPGAAGGGGGGGGGGYSTAAAPGYVNPFRDMAFGTGAHGGDGGAGGMGAALGALEKNDPHTFANVTSARGQAVNPALLGMVGGALAASYGKGTQPGQAGSGGEADGSTVPQGTSAARTSAGKPDPGKGGAPMGAASQNDPGEPSPDGTDNQKMISNLLNEARTGRIGPRIASIIRSVIGGGRDAGGGGGAGGSADGGGANDLIGSALGSLGSSMLPGMFGGRAGGGIAGMLGAHKGTAIGLGVAGLGLGAMGAAQNIGERVTDLTQLGSVQGGGAVEGAGYEVSARIMALNPFINTDQARQVMQMSLKSGFRGGEGDMVQDFMVKNFKDMSMSFADSLSVIESSAQKSGDSTLGLADKMKDLQGTLDLMKGLSGEGGAALPEREAQFESTVKTLSSLNVDPESANRSALAMQEMFKDNPVLRSAAPQLANAAAQSPMFMQQVAMRNGITGMLPGALPGALADAGIDTHDAFLDQAKYVANMVSKYPGGKRNQAAMFQELMAQQGVPMDQKTAYALYGEVSGGRDIAGDTEKSMQTGAGHKTIGSKIMDNFTRQSGAQSAADNFSASRQDGFTPDGQPPRSLPQSREQVGSGSLTAQGTVNGELRVTVDQQGRVTAPPTIQLTGQQKAVMAGGGSGQLNSVGPGDPNYMHAHNTFPGGR